MHCMKTRTLALAILAWLVCAPSALPAGGAPGISILAPLDGSILLARSVEVNGTARGSVVDWQEALKDDFDAGTMENLTNDAAGTLALKRVMYDNFDSPQLDASRWTAGESNGPTASISGGRLRLGGSAAADGWNSSAQVVSTGAVSDRLNGTLHQFQELGSAAYSVIGLWKDDQNFIGVGRGYDFYGMGPGQKAVLVTSASGAVTMESLGAVNEMPHLFEITWNGTSASFHMDGSQLATRAAPLGNARCVIRSAINSTGEFVDALWDDVSLQYASAGRFTSAVQDTLSAAPELSGVAWTASVPAGLPLDVRLRSADDPSMQGASDWATVQNGQNAGFPASGRYLQYAVLFGSPAGNGTALFRDIRVSYICAVKTVDVSTDDRATWLRAMGRENWSIHLDLSDGPRRIWARVTDVTGDLQTASVDIDIDTTEPTASLVINDGSAMAPSAAVNLTLTAYDAHGVRSMIVSEAGDFLGAEWQPYTERLRWTLSAGDGPKTVFARVRDENGWESAVASASVTLDTLPPLGTVRINAGGNYTRSTAVTLRLEAHDASGVSEMLLSNRYDFSGDDWLAFQPAYPWTLPPGNGLRTVYARFRDPAGHMSAPACATVMVDTAPPSFSFSINNGSVYSVSHEVSVRIEASDNHALGGMLLGSDAQFSGAEWQPLAESFRWTLGAGEGPATLFVKVRDAAENEAPAQTANIIVDTVAPLCVVSSLQAVTTTASFTVGWSGTDATSGLVGYDVQYREGNGTWTDWKLNFTNTTAVFTGQDGRTYTFRVRASDLAGNTGAYPENPKTTTTIRLPGSGPQPPLVSILTPESSAPYKGKVKFSGTARALAAGRTIRSVQWQVDNGAWLNAAGNENWSFEWDTAGASRGAHTLRVRSFDGTNYSLPAERTVRVDNPAGGGGGGTDMLPLLAVIAVVVVAGALGGLLVMRRRRPATAAPAAPGARPQDAGKPAAPAAVLPEPDGDAGEPAEAAPEAAAEPAGAGGEAAPAGESAEAAPEAPAAAAAPSALPPLSPAPRPPLELVRQLDPAQILPLVKAIHMSLPGELQYLQPELITELVVTGEQGKSKFGEPIVLIMNRWYFGDENKPNFLQRYNW